MNNAEPTPSEVAGFENDLKGHKVKAMLYNAQASEPAVRETRADWPRTTASRSSASPRPSRRTRPIRTGCWGSSTRSTRRFPAGSSDSAPLRRRDDQARPPGHPLGGELRGRDGEFVGMLGANGSGKTTLMRAALGLVPVAAGAVSVLDRPVTRGNSAIGYMPQNRGAVAGCTADRLGRRRQRRDRPALRLRPARQGDAARDRLGARRGRRARSRAALDRRTVGRRAPEGAARARRCSAGRACCCSTSR